MQEEIDTCFLLHAHNAHLNCQDIIIYTPDTDVFSLAITIWATEGKIFIKTGKQDKVRLIDIEKVVNRIDYKNKAAVCKTLLGLRGFPVRDKTSVFHS